MNAATLLLIIQGIEAAITAAPQVLDVVIKAKEFISALFKAGLISKEQQDAVHQHIDAVAAMVKAGIVPAHWQVQPDPA